jgi:peptidoglycan hydrolase-like protein with peptidoglycan-binding domain
VRSPVIRSNGAHAGTADGIVAGGRAPRWSVLRRLGWTYRDVAGCIVGAVATGAVLINGLFLQSGPHPAPIFNSGPIHVAAIVTKDATVGGLPRPRESGPVKAEPALPKAEPVKVEPPAPSRSAVEIISDIQRELARRGFYEGSIDGIYGSKTDTAIRDFEQAAGLKSSSEPNAALLRTITRSNVKGAKAATVATGAGRAVPPPTRNDPIAETLAPSKRVIAVQRVLAEYGYGQLKPTGLIDRETRTAIEKFERERKLPITGQASDRIARELAALSGRPLE